MVDDKGIGLVLAGGGAKGAYQVGVWQALTEMGLDRTVTGFSGASIGAINALLFNSADFDEVKRLWLDATEDIFLAPRVDADGDGLSDKGFSHAIRSSAGVSFPPMPHAVTRSGASEVQEPEPQPGSDLDPEEYGEAADKLLAAISESMAALKAVGALGRVSDKAKSVSQRRLMQGLYSNRNLVDLVDRIVPDQLQLKRPVHVSVYSIVDAKERYVDLTAVDRDGAVRAAIASACLPGVYAPMELDDELVCDGGVSDNRPIKPLYDAGWRRFVVVHLNGIARKGVRDMLASDQERFPGATIVPIIPGEEFDDSFMGGTMKVSPKANAQRIALGYEETMRQFSTLRLFPELEW